MFDRLSSFIAGTALVLSLTFGSGSPIHTDPIHPSQIHPSASLLIKRPD